MFGLQDQRDLRLHRTGVGEDKSYGLQLDFISIVCHLYFNDRRFVFLLFWNLAFFRKSRLPISSFTLTTGQTRQSMETLTTWHSFRWTRWKLFLAYWVHFTGCLLRPRSCGERCDPRTPNLSPSLWTGGLENDQVLNSIVSLTKGNRSHVWDSRSSRMTVEMGGNGWMDKYDTW